MINYLVNIITVLIFSVTTQDAAVLGVIQKNPTKTVLTPWTLPLKNTVKDDKEGRQKEPNQTILASLIGTSSNIPAT